MSNSPKLESIPIVDLRLLSQSDLYSLSLSSFDPNGFDDIVIPKIDRSVFNESLGSRKQTYSRIRLAPPSSTSAEGGSSTPGRRKALHLRSTTAAATGRDDGIFDPEHVENARVVAILKELFVSDAVCPHEDGKLIPVPIEYAADSRELLSNEIESHESVLQQLTEANVNGSEQNAGQKRKRGRPRIRKEETLLGPDKSEPVDVVVQKSNNLESKDRGVVNKDGAVVDFVALNLEEHPFTEEIKRRTEGLMSEVELLEFLGGLNGEWGSRRKKRRVVDADELGSALPVGWKLSLAVKKRNGNAWVHCRRYVSPSGLHFVTCKEVSSYLLSLHGIQDTYLNNFAQLNENANGTDKSATITVTDPTAEEGDGNKNPVSCISFPAVDSTSDDHQMQAMAVSYSVNPIASDKFPVQDTIGKGSIRSDNVVEVCNGLSGISPLSNDNVHDGELKMANRNIVEVNESADMVTLPYSVHESDGDQSLHNADRAKFSTDRIFYACSNLQEMESENCYGFPDNGASPHVVDENFAPIEKPENTTVPDSELFNSSDHIEACGLIEIKESVCRTRNDFREGPKNKTEEECVFDFFGSHDDHGKDFAVQVNQSTNLEFLAFNNNLNSSSKSPSMSIEPEFDKDSKSSILPTPQDGKEHAETNVSSLINKCNGDERYSSEISEKGSFKADNVTSTGHENLAFGISSDVPSSNDQRYIFKDFDSKAVGCQLKESLVLNTSMSGLGSLSGHNNISGAENNYDVFCGEEVDVYGLNRAQNFGNCDLNDSFNNSDGALFSNSCTRAKITTGFSSSEEEPLQSKLNQNRPSLSFNYLLPEAYTDKSSTPGDQKQVKPFDINFSGSLFPNRTHGNGIAFNMDQPGQVWSKNGGEKMGHSGYNSTACFATDSTHYNNVSSHGPWSTGQVFKDCFGGTSNLQRQASSFLNFDLTSHKTGEAEHDVRTTYDNHSNMLGSTPKELVEYSFMGEQVPSSPPGESKTLSCTRNPDQGLHPSTWLKDDALMPHSAHNNKNHQVTSSVCVWCGNVLYDYSDPRGIQAGEIGTMCPSCSRVPGQYNMP